MTPFARPPFCPRVLTTRDDPTRKDKKDVISMNKTNPGVALVTGASSGIGRATAKALQGAGFRVFGTSRRAAAERSDGVTMLTCDVTDDASVAKLVDEVLAKAGRIDLLVNNAGMGLLGGAEESSIAQAQALFDVNVFGVLRVTNAVLPTMRRQGKGRIVNLSSVQGFIPAPYFALYASTKHAIEGYSDRLTTNCARLEFALCWSSPPIPVRHSKKISPGRTSCLISMTLRAPA